MQLVELIQQHGHLWGKLPAALRASIDSILTSVQTHPLAWATAWDDRYVFLGQREQQGAPLARTRDVWWETETSSRGRRRGKAWASVCHVLMSADPPPDLDDGEYVWAAVIDAATDAVGALITYDEAASLLDAPVDSVRFLMASGNPVALLVYPAVLVRNPS
jgi:hypothetical protein